jgi:hypothetical protein
LILNPQRLHERFVEATPVGLDRTVMQIEERDVFASLLMQKPEALGVTQGATHDAIGHVVEDESKGPGSPFMQMFLADRLEPIDEGGVAHADPSVAFLHLDWVHVSSF